jgi:hypothetical protein
MISMDLTLYEAEVLVFLSLIGWQKLGSCGVEQYLGNIGRGHNKDQKYMNSSYCADDYALQKANLDRLTDTVAFQNRIWGSSYL